MSRKNSHGMSGHQRAYEGKSNEWLTPPEIIDKLGPFDLDPCSPINRPWDTARSHYTIEDNGLIQPWQGFVWLNPPYGPHWGSWLEKLSAHGNGIALIFARTETKMFFNQVWNKANALFFIKGRLNFHYVNGNKAPFNAGAPSVLVGYGGRSVKRLSNCSLEGKFIEIRKKQVLKEGNDERD